MRAIVLAIGLVCVTGCGRQAEEAAVEKAIELQTGGTARVDLSKETMQIETEEGKMTMSSGEGAKLPDSFPQDIYVLDGAKIEMAMEVPQGYSLAFTTDKDRAAVAEQYKKQMTSAGWTQKAAMDMGEQVMLAYEKPERAANIVITADESVTRVNVTVAQQ